ncbi:MAG: DUF4147 domain-containing protein [Planctomycetota bacterium]|nr:MAG: DUF4147 domain-containing protein [Planctomycetota bacterium]REK28958.1 MAG: DUF4147 domain-containing protein [Planctomycetota bacterium]REK39608.1 MAG: DUF4147 domain-containing protein [Planctomycetota bacterium]
MPADNLPAASRDLRSDALAIWRAGLDAVKAESLTRNALQVDGAAIEICGHPVSLGEKSQICVVGGGKAGGAMAAGLEQALAGTVVFDRLEGWINVPENCVRPLKRIHLHGARPAGRNEPTEEGVRGSLRILDMVAGLNADDVCVVLLSGGGSALLPAPAEGVRLEDKLAVTRLLSAGGATIQELNCVRKQLSRIKGGGLMRACTAGLTIALIISDVIGDPLQSIASGPTVPNSETPVDALAILMRYAGQSESPPPAVMEYLEQKAGEFSPDAPEVPSHVFNHIIGNNRLAVEAAAVAARELGYEVPDPQADVDGVARELGEALGAQCVAVREGAAVSGRGICFLSGGEPVVNLVKTDGPQKGGRNQELVLAAVNRLWDDGMARIAILSGGTDGEDGPTDAAGAVADSELIARAKAAGLDPADFLSVNNSYPFFDRTEGLIRTGPTETNVMDLRVALVSSQAS